MSIEASAISVIGEELDANWSQCGISKEQLIDLVRKKPEGLNRLSVDQGDDEPDFRSRAYKDATIPLDDFVALKKAVISLTDPDDLGNPDRMRTPKYAITREQCPEKIPSLELPNLNDYYNAIEAWEEAFLRQIPQKI